MTFITKFRYVYICECLIAVKENIVQVKKTYEAPNPHWTSVADYDPNPLLKGFPYLIAALLNNGL